MAFPASKTGLISLFWLCFFKISPSALPRALIAELRSEPPPPLKKGRTHDVPSNLPFVPDEYLRTSGSGGAELPTSRNGNGARESLDWRERYLVPVRN